MIQYNLSVGTSVSLHKTWWMAVLTIHRFLTVFCEAPSTVLAAMWAGEVVDARWTSKEGPI